MAYENLGLVSDSETSPKIIESIHTRDGMYCVDVIRGPDGFTLQTCRRDEERWQVIARPGRYDAQVDAVASALALIATFE
jgi:hypothetical protein